MGTMYRYTDTSKNACFGREDLCRDIVSSALDAGAVLMFGGRQAGKTTILRKIARELSSVTCGIDDLCSLTVPVYVDLMTLPYDAAPSHFFKLLSTLAVQACRHQISGFALQSLPVVKEHQSGLLESFVSDAQTIFEAAGNVNINFIFLLDEAKRVLFDRFPRGFQDNLFTLLFGGVSISPHCSLVFAGAQELYRFCEDETSPIGSRAEKHIIPNLSVEAVADIVGHFNPRLDRLEILKCGTAIHTETGGHAGMSSYLAFKLQSSENSAELDLPSLASNFQRRHSELFQIWTARLSVEARLVTERLLSQGQLNLKAITFLLKENGLSTYLVDRVFEELQFTGLAIQENESLLFVNTMYGNVARNYLIGLKGSSTERPVWNLLQELELSLRQLIRTRFDRRWHNKADKQIANCLGDGNWKTIQYNKDRYYANYNELAPAEEFNVLDFTYLGQLVQLITWQSSWEMFKHMFRDKRELEDMLRDIAPVRNDEAHFRSVPEAALERCRLRCQDLLVIVEKELAIEGSTITEIIE